MSSVTFSDGTTIQVDIVAQGHEYISGADRNFIEIKVDGNVVPYDTIKAINDNPSILDTIQYIYITEDETVVSSEYDGYVLPVGITILSNESFYSILFKLAQKSDEELARDRLLKENEEIQLALIELATTQAELEEKIASLTSE